MRLALREAERALEHDDVPVGAVVAHAGEVIGAGHNERELRQDPTAHAEVIALREAAHRLGSWRILDSTLYVTLEPCAMCAGAIVLGRVARVVYGTADPKAGAAGSVIDVLSEPRFNHRPVVEGGLLRDECAALLVELLRRAPPMTALPDSLRLGAAHLSVADLDRSIGFYQDALGLRQHRREDGVAALGAGGEDLLVLHEEPGARPGGRAAGLFHFALLYATREELARAVQRLAATRTPVSGASDHGVSEAIYLQDPDNHGIELYADRPRAAWPPPGTAPVSRSGCTRARSTSTTCSRRSPARRPPPRPAPACAWATCTCTSGTSTPPARSTPTGSGSS